MKIRQNERPVSQMKVKLQFVRFTKLLLEHVIMAENMIRIKTTLAINRKTGPSTVHPNLIRIANHCVRLPDRSSSTYWAPKNINYLSSNRTVQEIGNSGTLQIRPIRDISICSDANEKKTTIDKHNKHQFNSY